MMWHEFEELAGYEVSFKDYDKIIEPMYMATNLSKQEFVKVIDKKRFALKTEKQIIAAMKKEAKHIKETCEHFTDFEAWERLEALVNEYGKRFARGADISKAYTYPGYRGCTFPKFLVVWSDDGRKILERELVTGGYIR